MRRWWGCVQVEKMVRGGGVHKPADCTSPWAKRSEGVGLKFSDQNVLVDHFWYIPLQGPDPPPPPLPLSAQLY